MSNSNGDAGTIVSAVVGGLFSGPIIWSLMTKLWARLWRDPKAEAEARKLNAEADDSIVNRLYREIERIDKELRDVREELANVKTTAQDEKHSLEIENKRLRYEVSSLRKRVATLEEIINTKTTPEDMRAQLAEIDRKTAKGKPR